MNKIKQLQRPEEWKCEIKAKGKSRNVLINRTHGEGIVNNHATVLKTTFNE